MVRTHFDLERVSLEMFGALEGIEVGQIFNARRDLADAGVHAPLMAGIWGAQEGAYSIVLSGGYEDNVDDLDYILNRTRWARYAWRQTSRRSRIHKGQ